MAAIHLRKMKYKGSILMIGLEKFIPYQRPPLSKNFLFDNTPIERLYLKSMKFYKKNKIDLITGKKVITINKDNKKVTLQCGLEYLYNKLIIATGSDLKKLPVSCNKENIHRKI